jgi:hypothetical protein
MPGDWVLQASERVFPAYTKVRLSFRSLPSEFPATIADSVRPISLEGRVTPKRLVARLGRKGVCRTRRWQANGPLECEGQPRPHFFSVLHKNKRDVEYVRRA